jgi:hypothetical protein|tara:strand:- start:1239 stop:1391 length:153 start_codon:yes stop_codon:yes gene_type:complete
MLNIGVGVLMKNAFLKSLKLPKKQAVKTTWRNNLDAGMSRLNPHFYAVSK